MEITPTDAWKMIAGCLYEAMIRSQPGSSEIIKNAMESIKNACASVEYSDKLGVEFWSNLESAYDAFGEMNKKIGVIHEENTLETSFQAAYNAVESLHDDEAPNHEMSFDMMSDMMSDGLVHDLQSCIFLSNYEEYNTCFNKLVKIVDES